MRIRNMGLVLCGALSLTLGVLSPVGAARADAPYTTPAINDPTDGASVSGVVEINATSTAPRVRFAVDDVVIGTVSTVASAATQEWGSWGWAAGSHTISAFDCDSTDACNTSGASVSVTLLVDKPNVTSPVQDASLSGVVTFTATATGGGLAFYVDGVRRGFDAAAPYQMTLDMSVLADGAHAVSVAVCETKGVRCDGAVSDLVAFTATSLHPRITGQSPNPFSPNADKVKDATVTTYVLPDTETVYAEVFSGAGARVLGRKALGPHAAGTYTWTWNGLANTGIRVPDGSYTVVLTTSRGTLYGRAARSVKVDTVAPTMTSLIGAGTTFYPVVDGYRDTFAPTVVLNEPALLTLTVRTTTGTAVRVLSANRTAGRVGLTWNGRNSGGAVVPPGTYRFTLTATDPAGNRRNTASYYVYVSLKRLVATTFTVKANASTRVAMYRSSTCAYLRASQYGATGVWIYNGCNSQTVGYQWIELGFNVTVPAAISYGTVTLKAYGHTHPVGSYQPLVRLYGGLRATAGGWYEKAYDFSGSTSRLATLLSAPGKSIVSSTRQVRVAVGVEDYWVPPPNDFDLGYIVLVVNATVLR